jgi:hypothetical protein
MPNISLAAVELFNDLVKEKKYNRENFMKMIDRSKEHHQYTDQELEDVVEQLEASRGYLKDDIIKYLEKIEKNHGYNKSQMTKMLEKLNETDHYAILHYATSFNNVPFCQIIIEQYECSKTFSFLFNFHLNIKREFFF